MVSELSGNVIDLCPVGALTSKPYRYSARAWELSATPSIAIHDGVGSHLYLHHKSGEIKRVVPKEDDAINEIWLSDRDRFSYTGLNNNRLMQPMRKQDGKWEKVDWETALVTIASTLSSQAKQAPEQIGALVSPSTSLENLYLLKTLLSAQGIQNLDYRLHQQDFSLDGMVMPYLPVALTELEKAKAILLVGSNLRHEQPMVNHRVRKASLARAKIMAINPVNYDLNYRVQAKAIVPMQEMTNSLAKLVLAVAGDRSLSTDQKALLAQVTPDDNAKKMADLLAVDGKKVILLGQIAQSHPAFGRLLQLANMLAELTGATVAWMAESGNSLGACLLGLDTQGLSTSAMLKAPLSHLLLWNLDPQADILGVAATKSVECVIAFTAFDTPNLRQQADWLLPIACYGEEAGSFVNMMGQVQMTSAPLSLSGDVKPGWKVLRVLGNMMDAPAFDYVNLAQVTDKAVASLSQPSTVKYNELFSKKTPDMSVGQGLSRIAEVAIYSGDMLVRYSEALQAHPNMAYASFVQLNPADIASLGLAGGYASLQDQQGQVCRIAYSANADVAQGSVVLGIGVVAGVASDWITLVKEQK
jgi:NADH-quinone oxidoreductase subunit G